jgi:nitroreductase
MMVGTVQKMDPDAIRAWNTRQVYIALGQLMTAAAVLGIDTCPMEGIDGKAYDRVLGLNESDYSSVVGCAVGYRDASDKSASAKKVRFATEDMVAYL